MKREACFDILPDYILDKIFVYVSIQDLYSCALVCKYWNNYLQKDDTEAWRMKCVEKLSSETLKSDLLINLTTNKEKLCAFYHAWNPNDCSENMYVKSNGFTVHRRPEAQCTDAARGKIGFDSGRHAWEILWQGPLGTVAMVGVATKNEPMRMSGYKPLLGSSNQSWAWNLVDNYLFHDGSRRNRYPTCNNANSSQYHVGEKITVILDMEDCTLSFERDYQFLGIAFKNLPKIKLYPSISAVYGNTEVTMIYKGKPLDG